MLNGILYTRRSCAMGPRLCEGSDGSDGEACMQQQYSTRTAVSADQVKVDQADLALRPCPVPCVVMIQAAVRPRKIEMVVMKAETEDSWWPYLTYEKKKDPHIKTDFNKWVDEDEEDEENKDGGFDMSAMQNMANFGGGGGGGMGGMGGGGMGGMGGMDLSQMMAGMGGGGMGGMDMSQMMAGMGGMGGDMGEGDDDSDDEDLPDLEPSPSGAENL